MITNDCTYLDARNALVEGSAREDDMGKDEGGVRSYNHFYDPFDFIYGKGLSDSPPDFRIKVGNNSFLWASTRNCAGYDFPGVLWIGWNEHTSNKRSWQNARDNEWLGLTAGATDARFQALTNMFRAVGQVVHLLEDTSQPQHVRNEQHVNPFSSAALSSLDPWNSPIEKYGDDHNSQLNYKHSMLDWRGAGFTKLQDFWDRRIYASVPQGVPTALDSAEKPGGTQLGLAEWCNGNFLGARHLYAEYYQFGDIRYYPFPSKSASTDYAQTSANLLAGVHSLTLKNGQQIQAIYLNKTGAGVKFPDHSRFTYFGGKFPHFGMVTINDDNVLASYHNVLIPKAINYSAGLLDYFFRGQLGVGMTPNANYGLDLTITNVSGQDLKGGTFQLYYDDAFGNRTSLPSSGANGSFVISWDPTAGALPNNGTISATLTPPTSVAPEKYILVYQGTIGTTSGQPSDPVDQNIAIAATTFLPFSWWKMEETDGDRIDSVEGNHLIPYTDGEYPSATGTITGVPGKVGAAVQLAINAVSADTDNQDADLEEDGGTPSTPCSGAEVTWCGWWEHTAFNNPDHTIFEFDGYIWNTYGVLGTGTECDIYLTTDGANLEMDAPYTNNITVVPLPSADSWHFFLLEVDAAGSWHLQFDNSGTVYTLNGLPPTRRSTSAYFDVDCAGWFHAGNFDAPTSYTVTFDEVGVFPKLLTQAQKDYLYNSGAGRTFPFTLP